MAWIRVLARMQGESGSTKDVYQNTWHLDTYDINQNLSGIADDFRLAFETFYFGVGSLYSSFLDNTLELRFYDLAHEEPRVPQIRTSSPLFSRVGVNNLPGELAVVVTLLPNPPVTRRRRGRVYLGPFNSDALEFTTTGDPLVSPAAVSEIVSNVNNLLDNIPYGDLAVYSRVGNTMTAVIGGQVDNAFDIQRRRGRQATAVTPFGLTAAAKGLQGRLNRVEQAQPTATDREPSSRPPASTPGPP